MYQPKRPRPGQMAAAGRTKYSREDCIWLMGQKCLKNRRSPPARNQIARI